MLDISMTKNFSQSTIISPFSRIGEGVSVWANTQIRENSVIGSNTKIGSNVYIDCNVIIGSNCKIQNNAQIYDSAELEDGVFIGPGAILTNDLHPRAIHENNKLKTNLDWNKVGVKIDKGASIGAGSICIAPLTIGAWSLVGAGSIVTKDVPDYALVVGNPAKQIGWVGPAGIKLVEKSKGVFECPKTKITFVLTNETLSAVGQL